MKFYKLASLFLLFVATAAQEVQLCCVHFACPALASKCPPTSFVRTTVPQSGLSPVARRPASPAPLPQPRPHSSRAVTHSETSNPRVFPASPRNAGLSEPACHARPCTTVGIGRVDPASCTIFLQINFCSLSSHARFCTVVCIRHS